MAPSDDPSSSLLQRLRDGSATPWRDLVELWQPILVRWCRGRGVPEHEAEDVVQEVFQAAARNMATFQRPPAGGFRPWLATILRTKVCDYFDRQARFPGAPGGDFPQALHPPAAEDDSPDSGTPEELRILLLRRVLDLVREEFQPTTWEAFWRAVVEEHDTADIARDLGIAVSSVRKYKQRVLDRLRQVLRELGEPDA
jgi:RNA polymerase sigma-70 factor (ECF subfamily)